MKPVLAEKSATWVKIVLLVFFICLVVGLLFWMNYSVANFGGAWEVSDFMFVWLGGRATLDQIDFYNPHAWEALHVRYAGEYRDNPIFLYWLPVAYLFAPFALLPVRISAAIWLLCSEAMLIFVISRFWKQLPLPRTLSGQALVIFLFALFEPVVVVIWTGQYSMLMLFLAMLVYEFTCRKQDNWAGFFLMLLCLRPNPVALLIPLLLLWFLWQKRWRLLVSFSASCAAIALASELASPGWFLRWIGYTLGTGGKLSYFINMTPTLWGLVYDISPYSPAWIKNVIILILIIVLILFSYFSLRKANQLNLGAVLSISISLSLLLTPYAWNYDQVLLIFPLLWSLSALQDISDRLRARVWLLAGLIMLALPYSLRIIALHRQRDPYSALVSFAVLLFTLWAAQKRQVIHQFSSH